MGNITSGKSKAQLMAQKSELQAELASLISDNEYLKRKLTLNELAIDFVNFTIQRKDKQIAENAHLVEAWSPGYYSHDAD